MNQNNKTSKILLSGGGTAGHITPLLAVAKEYLGLDNTAEFHYIGQKGDKNVSIIENSDLPIHIHLIQAGKYRRYHGESLLTRLFDVKTNLLNCRDAIKFGIGIFQARKIINRVRPNAAFLKGGFVVVPVGKACAAYKIPYITHDSDPLPGLANRLIAKNAYAHAVAVEGVTAYPKEKMRVTGIPLGDAFIQLRNADRDVARSKLHLGADKVIIFIFAGTQGARTIDDAMNLVALQILKEIPNLHIIHVFGRLNQNMKETCYSHLEPEDQSHITKLDFVSNAYDYIAAADLIIGRAGATTLAEIAMIGRAAIIIPAAHLTGGHQVENARLYSTNNAACILNEDELSSTLAATIVSLAHDPETRANMEKAISTFAQPDAAHKIAQLIYEAAQGLRLT